MVKFTVYETLKAFYILMNADGKISADEQEKFDEIISDFAVADVEKIKNKIISDMAEDFSDIEKKSEPDLILFLLKETDSALNFDNSNVYDSDDKVFTEKLVTPRWLVFNMLTLAAGDGEYNKNEELIVKYIADKTKQPKSVVSEMRQYINTEKMISAELQKLENSNKPYSYVRPIAKELEERKKNIQNSVKNLILDEPEDEVEKLEIKKNTYEKAIDDIKEMAKPVADQVMDAVNPVADRVKDAVSPFTDEIEKKGNSIYKRAKDKLSESKTASELSEKGEKFADDFKSKVKNLGADEKVTNLFNKFKKK